MKKRIRNRELIEIIDGLRTKRAQPHFDCENNAIQAFWHSKGQTIPQNKSPS